MRNRVSISDVCGKILFFWSFVWPARGRSLFFLSRRSAVWKSISLHIGFNPKIRCTFDNDFLCAGFVRLLSAVRQVMGKCGKDYCIVFRRKCQAENRRLKNKIQIEANEKTYNRLRNYRQSVVRFSRGSFAFLFHFQPELSGGRNSECGSDSGCRCICNRYRSPRVTVKAVKPS